MADKLDTSKLGPIKIDYLPEIVPEGCKQVGWQVWKNDAPNYKAFVTLNEGLTDCDKRAGWLQRPIYVRN